ncbi:hypothetical protein FRC10_011957 [Ceratobasidium sp. 414]|nr:hypothetical protein FRC10_011957 [Ceratobasidium sp. 414]
MTLDDLNAHGGIEHDASYTRADVKWQPDQSVPNADVIRGLYESAGLDIDNLKPTDTFKVKDFSNYLAYRRAHSKVFNGQYLMSTNGKVFSCANSAIAYDVFAGNAADLKTWFLEERMPDNWEPRLRLRYGLTIAKFNQRFVHAPISFICCSCVADTSPSRSLQIGLGISRAGNLEEKVKRDAKRTCDGVYLDQEGVFVPLGNFGGQLHRSLHLTARDRSSVLRNGIIGETMKPATENNNPITISLRKVGPPSETRPFVQPLDVRLFPKK